MNNLLSFNQWSATEYLNNFQGFSQLGSHNTTSSSKEYSTIGEQSIVLNRNNNWWWFQVNLPSLPEGTNCLFSCDILGDSAIRYYAGPDIVSSVDVKGESRVLISCVISSNNYIRCLSYIDNSHVFFDNFSLTIQ